MNNTEDIPVKDLLELLNEYIKVYQEFYTHVLDKVSLQKENQDKESIKTFSSNICKLVNQIFDKKQDLSEQERDIFKDHLLRLQKIGDIVEQKIQKSLDKSEKKLRDYALMQEENTPNALKEFNKQVSKFAFQNKKE